MFNFCTARQKCVDFLSFGDFAPLWKNFCGRPWRARIICCLAPLFVYNYAPHTRSFQWIYVSMGMDVAWLKSGDDTLKLNNLILPTADQYTQYRWISIFFPIGHFVIWLSAQDKSHTPDDHSATTPCYFNINVFYNARVLQEKLVTDPMDAVL